MSLNLGLGPGLSKGNAVIPDPNLTSVVLQLHFENNANNAATTNPWTAVANTITYTSTNPRFGGYSGVFTSGHYLEYLPSGNAGLANNSTFTAEMWVNIITINLSCIFSCSVTGDTIPRITLYANVNGSLSLDMSNTGSTLGQSTSSSTGLVASGTWYAIALVRTGNNFYVYLNGSRVISTTFALVVPAAPNQFIGYDITAYNQILNGSADECRITDGVARYTLSNYTVQSLPFSP